MPAQAVYGIDPNHDPIDAYMAVRSIDGGSPTWVRDATLDDSDKSFTVPVGKVWKLFGASAYLVASATVGNRNLELRISNAAGDELSRTMTGPNITAGQTGRANFFGGMYSTASGISMLPGIFPATLGAGMTVRILDQSAVDAAADDMAATLFYTETDA